MTLSTDVWIHDEIDVPSVFHKCRELLGAGDDIKWKDSPGWGSDEDRRVLMNNPGQGLDAWLMVHFRPGKPLTTQEVSEQHTEDCEHWDDECHWYHPTACWCSVDFDTTYGYEGPDGEGCGALHAKLLARLGVWLDEQGVTWSWTNEFTGERWGGDERYARLVDLVGAGAEAENWFATVVGPAILIASTTLHRGDTDA